MHNRELPALPAGFTARPARIDEVEKLIQPMWAIDAIYNTSPELTLQDFASDLQRPTFDLEKDSRAIFAPNGGCAGYVDVVVDPPYVRNYHYAAVHPAYNDLGLGTWLTRWGINRLAERIADAPAHTQFAIQSWCYSRNEAAATLLQNEGYIFERIYLEMAIDLPDEDAPQVAPLPEGITLRTFDPDKDVETLFDAYLTTFRDHHGYVERTREQAFERWRFIVLDHPTFDANLVTFAEENGKVVGFYVTWHEEAEPTSNGYVQHIGTVRDWRRRGLARAMLTRIFACFHARGAKRVILGVDSSSPTGALNLYESSGMFVKSSTTAYKLTLREGDVPTGE